MLHKADTRGLSNFGWLNSYHSFSFGRYFDPKRVQFGALRVLNDDTIAPGTGFGTHPHDNMEIITIPLAGALEHKDSMGHKSVIETGDVQVMTAGTGIEHSEYNHSKAEYGHFLQLWIFPRERDLTPRYDQKKFDFNKLNNQFLTLVNPDHEGGLFIHQDAWISMIELEAGKEATYKLHKESNGVYAFVIEGKITINDHLLEKRDALGIYETTSFTMHATETGKVLLIEVPMEE